MKSTDKYYDVKFPDTHVISTRIIKTLNQESAKFDLLSEDIYALSHVLAYCISVQDNTAYETIVDYLWMSYRIEINHKMLLLDLYHEIEEDI